MSCSPHSARSRGRPPSTGFARPRRSGPSAERVSERLEEQARSGTVFEVANSLRKRIPILLAAPEMWCKARDTCPSSASPNELGGERLPLGPVETTVSSNSPSTAAFRTKRRWRGSRWQCLKDRRRQTSLKSAERFSAERESSWWQTVAYGAQSEQNQSNPPPSGLPGSFCISSSSSGSEEVSANESPS